MFYLMGHLWLYQMLALVLGFGFGWWAAGSKRVVHKPYLWAGAAVLFFGGLIAYLQLAKGERGLWWDIWMLLFLAYLVGTLIAWLLNAVLATPMSTPATTSREGAMAAQPMMAKTPATEQAAPLAGMAPQGMATSSSAAMAGAMSGQKSVESMKVQEAPMKPVSGGPVPLAVSTAAISPSVPPKSTGMSGAVPVQTSAAPMTAPQSAPVAKAPMTPPHPYPAAPIVWSAPDGASTANPAAEIIPPKPMPMASAPSPTTMAEPAPMAVAAAVPAPPMALGENAADHFDDTDERIIAARPPGLAKPEGGKKDDLKRISGIGRVNEGKLNELGVFHFAQIAAWTAEHAKWVNGHLSFPGRIQREKWVSQAKQLAGGADTEFSKRVKAGKVPTSS